MYDIERVNKMPFAIHAGFRWESAGDGRAVVSMRIQDFHLNGREVAHGGVVPILVDAAGATCLGSATGGNPMTVDLRVNLISAVRAGDTLVAEGKAVYVGSGTAHSSVVVTNQRGETVALGQLTCVIRRPQAGAAATETAVPR